MKKKVAIIGGTAVLGIAVVIIALLCARSVEGVYAIDRCMCGNPTYLVFLRGTVYLYCPGHHDYLTVHGTYHQTQGGRYVYKPTQVMQDMGAPEKEFMLSFRGLAWDPDGEPGFPKRKLFSGSILRDVASGRAMVYSYDAEGNLVEVPVDARSDPNPTDRSDAASDSEGREE